MSGRDPKSLILDAALSVFAEMGFERATIAHIRAQAGISNGRLFHHFPTKDAIAEALYLRGIASYQDGLLKALERHPGPKAARATVRAAVHHHLAWVEAHRDLAQFMYERGRLDWQPAHGAGVRKLNRATAVRIHDWIAPLAAAGVVRNLPLPVLAACVVAPAHFVARRWLSGMITGRPTSFTDALADAAWAALAPSRPPRAPESRRTSSAALIEVAALDAASAAGPQAADGAWVVAQMTMTAVASTASVPIAAEAQSVRIEAEGRTALVEVVAVDAGSSVTTRGHVVCLWAGADQAGADQAGAAAGQA